MKTAISFMTLSLFFQVQAQDFNLQKNLSEASGNKEGMIVETFNVGLAHGYNLHTKERTPHLLKVLKESHADVLCLQEVWHKKDRDIFKKALANKFPYIFYAPIEQKKSNHSPVCGRKDIFGQEGFVHCMRDNCLNSEGDDITSCIIESCENSLMELKERNPQCAQALFAKAEEIKENPVSSVLDLLNPFKRAGLFAYKGSNGLMLLSKHPQTSQSVLKMGAISTLARRDALVADIKNNNVPIKVYCTHLTSALDLPYVGDHTSWEDEHEKQVLHLTDIAKQPERAVVLGDFNCSPVLKDIDPIFEGPCAIFDWYFKRAVPKTPVCTFCSNKYGDLFLDHIYTKGLGIWNVKRVYDTPITLGSGNQSLSTSLSDHYGLQAWIGP